MDFTTTFEVGLLLRSIIFGAAAALICDLFRFLRFLLPAGRAMIFLQDLVLCLLLCALTLIFVFVYNSGIVRLYILAGAAAGAGLWFCTVSRLFFGTASRAKHKIANCFGKKPPIDK
ncbi:hypothetical protein SDC9_71759 [bioreactor metagenome]|uniref:Spore cortex protein YabQ n=1 Tax=bioreactor metagenome TaxID=1076179 RepID=A0A644YAC9_9ZZZZ